MAAEQELHDQADGIWEDVWVERFEDFALETMAMLPSCGLAVLWVDGLSDGQKCLYWIGFCNAYIYNPTNPTNLALRNQPVVRADKVLYK